MTEARVAVCASAVLLDGGTGLRFPVLATGRHETGFVVRHEGVVHGYLNRCTHAGVELDWQRGRFFDRAGLYLMCAMHGAVYSPATGRCKGGPCSGQTLHKIEVVEVDGTVFWVPDAAIRVAPAPPPMPLTPL